MMQSGNRGHLPVIARRAAAGDAGQGSPRPRSDWTRGRPRTARAAPFRSRTSSARHSRRSGRRRRPLNGRPAGSSRGCSIAAVDRSKTSRVRGNRRVRRPVAPGDPFTIFRRSAVRRFEGAWISRSVAMLLTGRRKTERVYRRHLDCEPTGISVRPPRGSLRARTGTIAVTVPSRDSHAPRDQTARTLRSQMVPGGGIEPPRPEGHQILSLARLPVPPSRPRPRVQCPESRGGALGGSRIGGPMRTRPRETSRESGPIGARALTRPRRARYRPMPTGL
jgi:hypothetical protein